MPENEQKVKYCPNCGGAMEFNIGKQKIVCIYCNTELELESPAKTVQKQDFSSVIHKSAAQDEWDNSVRVLSCGHCGAEITAAANLTSISCRYCGSSHMLESSRKAGIAPEALMPFRIQKHDANAIFSKWMKKRFFAPNALKTLAQQDKMSAVYTPFWTFDASAKGTYSGEGGNRRQESYTGKDGKRETRTVVDWHWVSGVLSKAFKDVLVYAGQEGAKLLGRMKTFNLAKDLIPFEKSYLAGFQSETYTVTPEQGYESAKEKMLSELKNMAESDIRRRYDEARNVHVDATFSDVKVMHVLLPVWFSGFTYNGKNFSVTINGATGEIHGAYPKSALKIIIFIVIIILIIVALVLVFRSNS